MCTTIERVYIRIIIISTNTLKKYCPDSTKVAFDIIHRLNLLCEKHITLHGAAVCSVLNYNIVTCSLLLNPIKHNIQNISASKVVLYNVLYISYLLVVYHTLHTTGTILLQIVQQNNNILRRLQQCYETKLARNYLCDLYYDSLKTAKTIY